MDEIIIKVSLDLADQDWSYRIYLGDDKYIACEEEEGSYCASSLENALDMAVEHAKELIARGK